MQNLKFLRLFVFHPVAGLLIFGSILLTNLGRDCYGGI